jgi:hypothetical protein
MGVASRRACRETPVRRRYIMEKIVALVVTMLCAFACPLPAQTSFERDTVKTSAGDLTITFIGHATLMFSYGGKTIHVDPWGKLADYAKLP